MVALTHFISAREARLAVLKAVLSVCLPVLHNRDPGLNGSMSKYISDHMIDQCF